MGWVESNKDIKKQDIFTSFLYEMKCFFLTAKKGRDIQIGRESLIVRGNIFGMKSFLKKGRQKNRSRGGPGSKFIGLGVLSLKLMSICNGDIFLKLKNNDQF